MNDLPRPLRNGAAYDVIVVGARTAGTATAMLLARRSLRTLLLDDGTRSATSLDTAALTRGGVLLMSRWGLLDDVVAAGTPAVKRTTFRFGDEHMTISLKPSHGIGALYAPRRAVLDRLLGRAALEAGVEHHERTTVTDLMVRDGRVVGVHAITADGRPVDLHAALVIGADGIRSKLARRLSAQPTRVSEHPSAVTYGYWSGLAADGYEWGFRGQVRTGVVPTNNGLACVFVSAPPDRIGRGGVALIAEAVEDGSPAMVALLRSGTAPRIAYTWQGHAAYLRRSHGPGWALVGSAGCLKDPASAHGYTDAFRDAELVARFVCDAFGRPASLDDALGDYQATRDRYAVPVFDVVQRIAGHRWDEHEIVHLLQQLSSAMADEVEMLSALEPEPAS